MGNWRIVVEGHGIHHNERQDDANAMTEVFVGELRAAGHEVTSATFELVSFELVSGHKEDVLPNVPGNYVPGNYVRGRNFEILQDGSTEPERGGIIAADPTVVRASV